MWTILVAAAIYNELRRLDFDPEKMARENANQFGTEKEADKKGINK
jgi:hypothetical protein